MFKSLMLAVALLISIIPIMASASVMDSIAGGDKPTWENDKVCKGLDKDGIAVMKIMNKEDTDHKSYTEDLVAAARTLATKYSACGKAYLDAHNDEGAAYGYTQATALATLVVARWAFSDDKTTQDNALSMAKAIIENIKRIHELSDSYDEDLQNMVMILQYTFRATASPEE